MSGAADVEAEGIAHVDDGDGVAVPAAVGEAGTALDVLIYGINYAPELVGVGRYSGELGRHLAAAGHRLRVVTAPPHYPGWRVERPYRAFAYAVEHRDGAVVIRCPLLLRQAMRGMWRLLAPLSFALSSAPVVVWQILRHRPDVVLCVEPTLLAAPAALLAGKLVGARLVLHVQDLEVDAAFATGHLKGGGLRRLALALERRVLRGFDAVVTISAAMRARLSAKGVEGRRLALVRNWVDLEMIRPTEGHNDFRDRLGLDEGHFVVLYAGSIGAKQALPVMLEAARSLAGEADIAFVVAGDGPERADLVARYGALPNLHVLPLQPEERLNELLNLADLHVLPQQAGAADLVLPSKLGGMLASGRPIVVTAAPGTELAAFLDGAAVVTPPGDAAALAQAILAARNGASTGDRERRLALARRLAKPACLAEFVRELTPPERPRHAAEAEPGLVRPC